MADIIETETPTNAAIISILSTEDQFECTLQNDCLKGQPTRKGPGLRKVTYKNRAWHESCFICHQCKIPIGTNRFIALDDHIYCVPCYHQQFTPICSKCRKVITDIGVVYSGDNYHDECFKCDGCDTSLCNQRFALIKGFKFCGECVESHRPVICLRCQEPIKGSSIATYVSYEGKNWHPQCFYCLVCRTPLADKGFIEIGSNIYCSRCA